MSHLNRTIGVSCVLAVLILIAAYAGFVPWKLAVFGGIPLMFGAFALILKIIDIVAPSDSTPK